MRPEGQSLRGSLAARRDCATDARLHQVAKGARLAAKSKHPSTAALSGLPCRRLVCTTGAARSDELAIAPDVESVSEWWAPRRIRRIWATRPQFNCWS